MGMPTVPFAFSRQNPTAAADRGGLGVAILAGTMRQLRAATVCDQSIRGPRSDAEYLARRQASKSTSRKTKSHIPEMTFSGPIRLFTSQFNVRFS
jgi:hypothetical protein